MAHRCGIELIPKFATLVLNGQKLTIHGDGRSARAFLYAGDAARAFDIIFHHGHLGETYNITSRNQLQVTEIGQKILRFFGRESTNAQDSSTQSFEDRPFNDSMYWTNGEKLRELGWSEDVNFDDALKTTLQWYCQNGDTYWNEDQVNGNPKAKSVNGSHPQNFIS
jgi:dTDP-D-glucose 4,6-dehydratase